MPALESYDKKLGYSYCLGVYPCMLLLENRPKSALRLLLSDISRGEGVDALREKCSSLGVREEIAPKALKRISGKDNCYAALAFEKFEGELKKDRPHAVFHNISDSGNLGTSLRSAVGFGYEDVALIRPCADVFEPHTLRASMGAFFLLRLKTYDSIEDYLSAFPGRELYPFMLDGALDMDLVAPKAARAHTLIFGNEAAGLPAYFQKLGRSVKIDQSDRIDSLNLSVAASVAMYTFSRYQKKREG